MIWSTAEGMIIQDVITGAAFVMSLIGLCVTVLATTRGWWK
jgi:hypothetical protein